MRIEIDVPSKYLKAKVSDVKNRSQYDTPGVYVFYSKDDTPLYVGKTISFRRRFSAHAKKSEFYHLSSYVKLYRIKREYDKDIFETYLINKLRPEYNRAKTFYIREEYEDMLDIITESIADKQYEIRELRTFESDLQNEDDDDYEALGEMLNDEARIAELESEIRALQKRKATLMIRMTS